MASKDEAWVHVQDPRYDRYGFKRPEAIASLQQEFEVDYAKRISQQERRWHRHETTAREDTSRTKELKRLARNGIPPSRRGEIWQQMAGADGLRSREVTGYFEGLVQQEEEDEGEPSAAVRQIELDLARTFPGHRFFATDKGQAQLRQVLVAYSLRNPCVGYVQPQHGFLVIAPLAEPQLGPCGSSGRAWQLWLIRHSKGGESTPLGIPSHLGCSSSPPAKSIGPTTCWPPRCCLCVSRATYRFDEAGLHRRSACEPGRTRPSVPGLSCSPDDLRRHLVAVPGLRPPIRTRPMTAGPLRPYHP